LNTSNFAARRVNELNTGWLGAQISIKLAPEPESSAIVVVTGSSGFVKGHLLSTPGFFQMELETGPLEVKEVVLDRELSMCLMCPTFRASDLESRQSSSAKILPCITEFGDSGSWVWVFKESGKPYAVIIAGVNGSRVAYILPLAVVIQDMTERLDSTVQLPKIGFWDSYIQAIGRFVFFQMFITIARLLLSF
jgi:hypothetical protein